MDSPPSARAALALVALGVFTVLITWRAKVLEGGLARAGKAVELTDKPAPDFALRALDGRTVSLADFRGKKTLVVTFWASWCGPCRMEMAALREFYSKKRKADSDFEVLAISIDDDRASAETAATQDKIPFPVLLDTSHAVADAYRVRAIPTLLIIDKDGKVTYGQTGFSAGLEMMLPQLLHLETDKQGME